MLAISPASTETLTYQIMSFDTEVGSATLRVNKKKGRVSKLEGTFRTEGTLRKIHPIENKQVTYVNRKGDPRKTFQKRSETVGTENFNIRYRGRNMHVFHERNGKESKHVRKYSGPVEDVLTALYAVNEWSTGHDISEGSSMSLTMFSGHQFYGVTATAGELDQIWTPYRGIEKARKVNVTIERLSGRLKGTVNKVTVWTDASKSQARVGLLKAVHHFKLMGNITVLIKSRHIEKTPKRRRLVKLKT